MRNKIIYEEAKQKKVFLWQVAEKLQLCDSALSKRLRKELSDKEKQKILKIIEEIVEQQKTESTLGDD